MAATPNGSAPTASPSALCVTTFSLGVISGDGSYIFKKLK